MYQYVDFIMLVCLYSKKYNNEQKFLEMIYTITPWREYSSMED